MVEWARAAFDIQYDFEDSVYELECLQDSLGRQFTTKFRLSSPVKKMISQIQEMSEVFLAHHWDQLRPSGLQSGRHCLDVPTLKWQTDMLLGLDDTIYDLVNLTGGGNWLRVISIIGDGGCGKTAVAVEVLRLVKCQFEISAAIIGREDDPRMMLVDLWIQLTGEKYPKDYDMDNLVLCCRKILHKKRFIILVDDLWNVVSWEKCLSLLFPDDCNGSVVLVTTRQRSIGAFCSGAPQFVVELLPLDDSSSRDLFVEEISQSVDIAMLKKFEPYLSEILGRCGGNPLAIIACASHIRAHGASFHGVWKDLATSVAWMPESSVHLHNLIMTVRLSFNRMPLHLRSCALLLVGFPTSSLIDVDLLIFSWVAEGFVPRNQPSEDVYLTAHKYVVNLLNHRILEAVEITPGGQVISVKVPRIMRDMLSGIAYKNGFFGASSLASASISEVKLRRLSVVSNSCDELSSSLSAKCRWTRFVILQSCNMWPQLPKFEFLRVLIVRDCCDFRNKDLEEVMKLVYLKVLAVEGWSVSLIPQNIGDLSRLEGLFLYNTAVCSIPYSYSRLKAITCIKVGDVAFPRGLSELSMLEVLEVMNVGKSEVEALTELCHLTRLRVLACSWYANEMEQKKVFQAFTTSLRFLLTSGSLEELELSGTSDSLRYINISSFGSCKHLQKLWLGGPTYRPQFSLSVTGMRVLKDVRMKLAAVTASSFAVLGWLPMLLSLQIWIDSGVPSVVKFSDRQFAQLECLLLSGGSLNITFDAGCLPKLNTICLVCSALQLVGIANARAVKEVTLFPFGDGDVAEEVRLVVEEAIASHRGSPELLVMTSDRHNEAFCVKDKSAGKTAKKAPETVADKDSECNISILNIQVGLIRKAWKHPSADSLLVEEIDLGDGNMRQVVSDLAKYCSPDDLTNRHVVLITNVKPGKLRDVMSAGLVLCASTEDHTAVEPLIPPEGAKIGEHISFAGFDGKPEDVLNPKKKQLDKVTPHLRTDENGIATFKGIPFTTSVGPCRSSIRNGNVKAC
ncbi:unnamed protein product [Urochloa humidicola]